MQKKEQEIQQNKEQEEKNIQPKNNQGKQKETKQFDQFDEVLNNFDETPLNLTNDEKDKDDQEDDPEMMAKLKQQCDNFMKQMQMGFTGEPNQKDGPQNIDMDNLGSMFGNLLKGLSDELGTDSAQGEQFGKKFSEMFKSISEDNVEDAATKLLNQFMDKSLLLEPMQETKVNYQQFFQKQKNNEVSCSEADLSNYKKQYEIVNSILNVLQKDPNNKTEMIKLFEEMQQYGNPPQGIAPQTGSFF